MFWDGEWGQLTNVKEFSLSFHGIAKVKIQNSHVENSKFTGGKTTTI